MTGSDHQLTARFTRPLPARTLGVEHVDLFPTRIWQSRLTHVAASLPTWVNAATALRAASPAPAGRSNRQGWNSVDNAVLDRPDFAELNAAVRACCQYALQHMAQSGLRFRLESWINIHDRGGFNFLHMHNGALLSGTVYLQTPEGSGALVFRDPRPGPINAAFKGQGANAHNEIHLSPSPGLVVVFPHWLEHYVEPHQGDAPRIAVAFNALETPS